MFRTHNTRSINKHKHKKSISSAEEEFFPSKSYESELIFTFNTPITSRGTHFDKQSPLSLNNEGIDPSNNLSYSVPTSLLENEIFTRRSHARITPSKLCNSIEQDEISSDKPDTVKSESFKSDMTQELPSMLMMNVNSQEPPSYDSIVSTPQPTKEQKLPNYKQVVPKNPSSRLDRNSPMMDEILERERYLMMPRNSMSLKDTFDLALMSGNADPLDDRSKTIVDGLDDYSSSSDDEYLPISTSQKNKKKTTKKHSVVKNEEKGKDDWLVTQFLIDEYSVHGRAYESKRRNTDHGFGRLQEDMFDSSSDEE